MLLLIFMCFLELLNCPVVHGNPNTENHGQNTNKVVGSYSENAPFEFSDSSAAFLPPSEEEYNNAKHNKTVKKRSAGRQVNLPADIVKKLIDKPISDFYCSIEANRKIILDSHNNYRCNPNPTASNMVKLTWNDDAAKSALAWAQKCIQGHSPTPRNIPKMRCGENILLAPYKLPWDIVTDSWFSEVADFSFGIGSVNGQEVGHYTQLMWGPSAIMGCGVAECPNLVNKYNYVCQYCPAGNRKPTEYPYKRGKPCADCLNSCENNLCTNPCLFSDKYTNCKDFMTGSTCGSDQSLITDCGAMCECTKGEIK
ncbi:serotriflin-like [Aquarana catesbeiana]|uniref:serotriflin-like n=1 Tax=Aquarana catesbeiana TaxID=8400 RepID=UPI003CC9A387